MAFLVCILLCLYTKLLKAHIQLYVCMFPACLVNFTSGSKHTLTCVKNEEDWTQKKPTNQTVKQPCQVLTV